LEGDIAKIPQLNLSDKQLVAFLGKNLSLVFQFSPWVFWEQLEPLDNPGVQNERKRAILVYYYHYYESWINAELNKSVNHLIEDLESRKHFEMNKLTEFLI